jgi:sortase B
VVRFLDNAVDALVMVVLLALLALGTYALWDTNTVYAQADSANYRVFKPTYPRSQPSFEDLQAMNPDVFGWLDVYGTNIDYPLVQGTDDDYYLTHDATGAYSLSGSLFLDSRCDTSFSGFDNLIYGHHMDANAMFGQVTDFLDPTFFDEHQYGNIYYDGANHGIQFIAVMEADAYTCDLYDVPIEGEACTSALAEIESSATNKRDVEVSASDHLVLLSTCADSSTNGRTILIGKIYDQTFDNPFPDEVATGSGLGNTTEGLLSWLRSLPWWVWAIIVLLILLLIILIVWLCLRRRRRRRRELARASREEDGPSVGNPDR